MLAQLSWSPFWAEWSNGPHSQPLLVCYPCCTRLPRTRALTGGSCTQGWSHQGARVGSTQLGQPCKRTRLRRGLSSLPNQGLFRCPIVPGVKPTARGVQDLPQGHQVVVAEPSVGAGFLVLSLQKLLSNHILGKVQRWLRPHLVPSPTPVALGL